MDVGLVGKHRCPAMEHAGLHIYLHPFSFSVHGGMLLSLWRCCTIDVPLEIPSDSSFLLLRTSGYPCVIAERDCDSLGIQVAAHTLPVRSSLVHSQLDRGSLAPVVVVGRSSYGIVVPR